MRARDNEVQKLCEHHLWMGLSVKLYNYQGMLGGALFMFTKSLGFFTPSLRNHIWP